ncbi:MAG: hypothetical protein J6O61_05040 [Butyrivibrio sp.]|uniref:hypothetical protein n=1 Tax=Butyrivibrio sp. TaxID=28121 RepID=UPI001B11F1B8|nr:hypothetical protein [Butyrivibrio sp.]MBO6240193.1 hypothetical protein [Butyrivibrio sp.]
MRKETNEQLEAKIAQRKKSLAELEERLQKQIKRQEEKENKEIISLVRGRFKTLDAFKEYLGEDLA